MRLSTIRKIVFAGIGVFAIWLGLAVLSLVGYTTAIIAAIQAGDVIMLLVRAGIPPVGVIWGWGHLVGAW